MSPRTDYLCDIYGCANGGTCAENDEGERVCYCAAGYSGELCEDSIMKTTLTSTPMSTTPVVIIDYLCDFIGCLNGGTCADNEVGDRVCFCVPGFTGELCQEPTTTTASTTTEEPTRVSTAPPSSTTPSSKPCNCVPKCPWRKFFNETTCQCECINVRDCLHPRKEFSADTCNCECTEVKDCTRPRQSFNKATCRCECTEVRECPHPRKSFNKATCMCECDREEKCEPGYYFDAKRSCKCKRKGQWPKPEQTFDLE